MQDIPGHSGEVLDHSRNPDRHHNRFLLWNVAALRRYQSPGDFAIQRHRHLRQLRRGLVRHPCEYFRQFTDGLRRFGRQTVSLPRHSTESGNEYRDASDQCRTFTDAIDPSCHSARLCGCLLHWLCDRRIALCGGITSSRRYLHENRGYRCGHDEDRLQNRRRRPKEPRRDRGLYG